MYYPNTSNANALGVITHMTGPDGALISENGFVPVIWDSDPTQESPGWHIFRKGRVGYLKPSTTNKLRYNNLTGTRNSSTENLVHSVDLR